MRTPFLLSSIAFVVLAGCASNEPKIVPVSNIGASLSGELPANPLQWRIITAEINGDNATMSTLYGNDAAIAYARTHSQHEYPAGSILALVTWTQKDDDRWYGARIPNRVVSVEFVRAGNSPDRKLVYSYERFEGSPLKKISTPSAADRITYLLMQRAAVMP